MSNLFGPKVNPRKILKSSHHAMFPSTNEIDNGVQDQRKNKRFARCKEAIQAKLFHNFIDKTTIPQAPVRKTSLQEVMLSSGGFVEAVNAGHPSGSKGQLDRELRGKTSAGRSSRGIF